MGWHLVLMGHNGVRRYSCWDGEAEVNLVGVGMGNQGRGRASRC